MIKRCTCKHAYQDKLYGKGLRVHNKAGSSKDKESKSGRCTVCGDLKR